MVQAIDVPILEIPSIQKAMTIDELSSMWNVFSKCKNSIENGRRLENLSWRLWYRESSLQQHHQSSSVSTCSTFGPATLDDHRNNTTMDIQINDESNNIVHLTENKEITKEEIPYQLSNQQSRKSKFFVDNSDTEDDDDEVENNHNDDDDDDDDDMWSTFDSNHEGKQYLEVAYQKKFTLSSLSTISTMTTATTLDDDEEDMENAIKSSLHYNHQCLSPSKPAVHHQQQKTSLLSKLFKQEQQQKVMNHHYDIPPELPPTLQSCVDWEKTQNMIIPCKLGQSPILPDENIIW
ncbi:hypothetical protein BJ944DRAFT_241095 [Cunninghamella echinulata]|nr:hypothetical protein BJ944DRAFT_241095 [Cunninghamella echinulata]